MSTVQKSMRIPKELINELKAITQESGKDFSTVTKELLQEAIKMRRCPGIVFTEGVNGYRARIAGTGIEVWEVIASYKNVDEDFKRLRKTFHWLTEHQLKTAIGYWKIYPDEIDHLITQNESWTKERIHERYPFLKNLW
jgi:uncharacterized protein (DUF433 family)